MLLFHTNWKDVNPLDARGVGVIQIRDYSLIRDKGQKGRRVSILGRNIHTVSSITGTAETAETLIEGKTRVDCIGDIEKA